MARRKASDQLTRLELEIMNVLWDRGPASVQAVQERLAATLAYTTVQTMLNILWRKGKVKRTLVDRAYHYRPAITRTKAVAQTLRDVVDRVFGGSAEALVLGLMETKQLTPEALERLRKSVEEES
jgi:BlaI family transcriptional regulator, penicillinase repressor